MWQYFLTPVISLKNWTILVISLKNWTIPVISLKNWTIPVIFLKNWTVPVIFLKNWTVPVIFLKNRKMEICIKNVPWINSHMQFLDTGYLQKGSIHWTEEDGKLSEPSDKETALLVLKMIPIVQMNKDTYMLHSMHFMILQNQTKFTL